MVPTAVALDVPRGTLFTSEWQPAELLASVEPDLRVHRVPAIVLGSSVGSLGVVRALHALHIVTHVIAPRRSMTARSRGVMVPAGGWNVDRTTDSLRRFLHERGLEAGVLFPCDDGWLDVVARLVGEDMRTHPSSVPPPDAVRSLADKWIFAQALERLGIPRPATIEVRSLEDLAIIEARDRSSYFLKPRDSQRFTEEFGEKGIVLDDPPSATRRLEQALASGHELLAQEWVAGPPRNHVFLDGFVDRHGRIAGLLARRRIRMYPRRLGNSTDTVTIPLREVEDAVGSLRRLFQALRYRGVFDAEFKRDVETGVHKIIEVNARTWWQIELTRAAGIDVVGMAYLDALGMDVAPARRYRIGRRWVHTFPDIRARLQGQRADPLPDVPRHDGWFRARHAVFRWSDPRPGLSELARATRIAFRHGLRS